MQVPLLPQVHRSIPACAGEPPERDIGRYQAGVYPRVCGGTRGDASMHLCAYGLSPRVRGNRRRRVARRMMLRSIPACAGEP